MSGRGRGRPEANGPRALLVRRRGRHLVGEPLFERGAQQPLARSRVRPREGRVLLCRIERQAAVPIADLGRGDRAADVVAALIADRGLRPTFPKRVEAEAASAVSLLAAEGTGGRRDLTGEPTFTVDPATARDFDDAVSARREGDGVRLLVHIADVAAYVRPGGAVDREALRRGNSTYAPQTVVPMLPGALSDDACSLNPGVERFAVTAEIELSGAGETRRSRFYRSVVRSDARLDYDGLDRIFAGRERPPEGIVEALALARDAAATLADQDPGGLEVTAGEPEFEFDGDGQVVAARAIRQTEAHRLIERLMILTNEQVAMLLERKGIPTLYRVHEQPDPRRIELLIEQLAALEVPTPPVPDQLAPRVAGMLAAEASRLVASEAQRRGHGAGALSSLVLRAMKQARYSERNEGHAGLALPAYLHFTSPIRRYPDLIAHRALLSAVGAGEAAPDRHEVASAAAICSERERDAMRLERDADDVCACFLLERELFERGWDADFEGEVTGVVGAGAFVRFRGELADIYEGFLPARRIPGDRYEINEWECGLVGVRTGRTIGIGDPVEVRVEGIEAPRGRVDLLPADPDTPISRRAAESLGGVEPE